MVVNPARPIAIILLNYFPGHSGTKVLLLKPIFLLFRFNRYVYDFGETILPLEEYGLSAV